jgi:hypothetical protein
VPAPRRLTVPVLGFPARPVSSRFSISLAASSAGTPAGDESAARTLSAGNAASAAGEAIASAGSWEAMTPRISGPITSPSQQNQHSSLVRGSRNTVAYSRDSAPLTAARESPERKKSETALRSR